MTKLRVTIRKNPWALGGIAGSVTKLEKLGVRSQTLATLRDMLDTLGKIEASLSAIERADANRAAAAKASADFRKRQAE
jgi:hypothetical protein